MNNLKEINKPKRKFLDKRIPTILGLVILVVALVAGTLLIGQGGGVFSPRASAETTPKKIRVTNVYDTSFTISFLTDGNTAGFVKYGTSPNSLKSQAGDDRDQISGTVGSFRIHHITVRGLQQNTTYYYVIGTGSGSMFDDNGQSFQIKTASRNGAPAAAKTIYGSVTNKTGGPAEGSIVYVTVDGARAMSSQVKASGSWAVPLSNARTIDGNDYAKIVDSDSIIINVQGPLASQTASLTTTVTDSQPVAGITFGQNSTTVADTAPPTNSASAQPTPEPTIEPTPEPTLEPPTPSPTPTLPDSSTTEEIDNDVDSSSAGNVSSRSALLNDVLNKETHSASVSAITTLDLNLEEPQIINTTDPLITGTAVPNVTISITVHSETQIQQDIIADENGEFSLDIAQLSESLEPGEHTVTYSYTDPDTGEIIEKTVTFTVDNPVDQLADASNSEPYGSGNPYPIATPSLATGTAEASESAEATQDARNTLPATDEGMYVSGSVGTTLALVFGGLFFIISGLWSFWISTQLEKGELEI